MNSLPAHAHHFKSEFVLLVKRELKLQQVLRECLCPAHIIVGQHLVTGEGFGGYERDGVAVCIRVYSLPAHQAYFDGNGIDLRVGQILEVMQCFDHEPGYGHIDIFALMRLGEDLHHLCRAGRPALQRTGAR